MNFILDDVGALYPDFAPRITIVAPVKDTKSGFSDPAGQG
jgi:hypothetical protein